MKSISFTLVRILLVFTLCSCTNSKVRKQLVGNWSISEGVYKNQDIFSTLLSNITTFSKDGTCGLPATLYNNRIKKGRWVIIDAEDDSFKLRIITDNEVFAGEYEVRIEDHNGKKQTEAHFTSETVQMMCVKSPF